MGTGQLSPWQLGWVSDSWDLEPNSPILQLTRQTVGPNCPFFQAGQLGLGNQIWTHNFTGPICQCKILGAFFAWQGNMCADLCAMLRAPSIQVRLGSRVDKHSLSGEVRLSWILQENQQCYRRCLREAISYQNGWIFQTTFDLLRKKKICRFLGTYWLLHALSPIYCKIYPQYKGKLAI